MGGKKNADRSGQYAKALRRVYLRPDPVGTVRDMCGASPTHFALQGRTLRALRGGRWLGSGVRRLNLVAARQEVPAAFDEAAGSYDVLTGLNPGYHRHLRLSAERLDLSGSVRVLDLCCGTGASTHALVDALPEAQIVAVDASIGMLQRARAKRFPDAVRFVHGDAMDLDAADVAGPFDGILMAYGIRNVSDIDVCLAGLFSRLRPAGRICFHEYSVADSALNRSVWKAVTALVIIPGGFLASGSAELYRYLRSSVLAFDGVEAFERRLRTTGFVGVRTEPMDGWQRGIVHSFIAERPVL